MYLVGYFILLIGAVSALWYGGVLKHVAPAESELVGVAMHCPSCGEISLNVVTQRHLDVPFYHDRVVRYIERPFGDRRDLTLDRFHEQLFSSRFDGERASLEL